MDPPITTSQSRSAGSGKRLTEVQTGVRQPVPSLTGPDGNICGVFERHVLQVMDVHERS